MCEIFLLLKQVRETEIPPDGRVTVIYGSSQHTGCHQHIAKATKNIKERRRTDGKEKTDKWKRE